jgi:hypothetical protein
VLVAVVMLLKKKGRMWKRKRAEEEVEEGV